MTQRSDRLLTDRQREYLQNDEPTGNLSRELRRQIRERVKGALEDFKLLFNEMEHRDIVQFKQSESDAFDPEFQNEYIDSVAFLSRIAFANSVSLPPLFEQAIQKSYNKEHGELSDVSIQINTTSIDDIDGFDFSGNASEISLTRRNSRDESGYGDQPTPEVISSMGRSQIEAFIRSHHDVLGPDISLVDEELPSTSGHANPDIIGRDENGQLVLIIIDQVNEEPTPDAVETTVEKLQDMIREYGGEGHAKGILITLSSSEDIAEIVDEHNAIECIPFVDVIRRSHEEYNSGGEGT